MAQDSDSRRSAIQRWWKWSWGFIAPWMIALALMHVWDHTVTRYASGTIPNQFGIYFGHGDFGPVLLIALLLLICAVWLVSAAILIICFLFWRYHISRPVLWLWGILFVALGITCLPVQIWDQILLSTTGPGKAGGQLLASAANHGDIMNLRKLLDHGIAVDSPNYARTTGFEYTALTEASRSHQPKAVALLLERGADPNRRGLYERPLAHAVLSGDAEIVRLLVEHGADPCISIFRYDPNVRREVEVPLPSGVNDAILATLPACSSFSPAPDRRLKP
jgi:ankyrin repeat protein